MHKRLLASCSAAALAAAVFLTSVQTSAAADSAYVEERVASAFEPAKYISVEGALLFSHSDSVLSFDPEDDKFGNLSSLDAAGDGWQGSVEFGSRINPVWDYRVGASVIQLDSESDQAPGNSVTANAETDLRFGYADAEIGYRPDFGNAMGLRLLGGVRGLVASGNSSFSTADKLGEYDDDTWAIGPRIGAGIAIPVLDERGINFVGSVAGAALFGKRDIDYSFDDGGIPIDESFSDSVTIWNADAMAGFAIPLTSSANITLGYKAQAFGNLLQARGDIDSDGNYSDNGDTDLLVHGPFVKMTISLD